jgi:hypothetical protein
MYTSIKTLDLETFLYNNYLTLLIILILLRNYLLKLYTKLAILIFDL